MSQLTELWLCMSWTAQRDCPWPSLSQEVLWTSRFCPRSVLSGPEPVDAHEEYVAGGSP